MIDIRFQGKRLENGEWVRGDLRQVEGHAFILDYDIGDDGVSQMSRIFDIAYSIDPSTIGQYSGRKDASKQEVYDGHIIQMHDDGTICAVAYDQDQMCWTAVDSEGNEIWLSEYADDDFSIIGNIHDNPELLGGHIA